MAKTEVGREEKSEVKKTIAYAMFRFETNSFSPVLTTMADFEAAGLAFGQEVADGKVIEEMKRFDEFKGFRAGVKELNRGDIEAVPIYRAWAMSGGPIEADTYSYLKNYLVDALKEMKQLDGLYLSLHGAMGVEGIFDPEGDLLRAIRAELGSELPIGISYDLHANVTRAHVELATFIIGYQTNPHRDHYRTGYKAAETLIRTVRGEVNPVMAFRKMPLLKGGGMTIDFLPPVRAIFKRMKKMEKHRDILSVSNYSVHLWLDEPEVGWSVVVVADGNRALAEQLADELAELNWQVRDARHNKPFTPAEAISKARQLKVARKLGTVMFCDAADAIGAGAPGENAWILKALLEDGSDLVSYVPLKDVELANELYSLPLNEQVTVTLGGKLEPKYNTSVEVTGQIIHKLDWLFGKTVILKKDGIHIIITEHPPNFMVPKFYRQLGLSLWKADIVIAKNLFPFRFTFLLYNRKTIDVLTPGTTSVDVFKLEYNHIPRPIYPLDKITDWR